MSASIRSPNEVSCDRSVARTGNGPLPSVINPQHAHATGMGQRAIDRTHPSPICGPQILWWLAAR
jgi:hypothetical protein